MCLAEKGVPWESQHVDIFRFENYEPWYTKLNPKAVVPTMDHDGRILIESNVMLEYLEDNFPQVKLRPDDLYARAMMRLWIYNSEESAHWNVNTCSHNLRHAKRMDQRYTHAEQLAAAERCPNPMIANRLKRRLEVGVSVEEEEDAYQKLDYMLDQMELRLGEGPWLAARRSRSPTSRSRRCSTASRCCRGRRCSARHAGRASPIYGRGCSSGLPIRKHSRSRTRTPAIR
jgi:glutathione S-transferase